MNNIKFPEKFQRKLQDIMEGIYELFELSKEHNLETITIISKDGVTRYIDEGEKTCSQVSRQYDRPTEFLQSLLDIIRVNYEPYVYGTFFLNSNMDFLYEEVPNSSFRLGYVSVTSKDNRDFLSFWNKDVIPYVEKCGYNINAASAIYAVASTGAESYGVDFMSSISATLGSGFSVDDVFNLLGASICEAADAPRPRKKIYSGYCLDPALANKTRLSLWLFLQPEEYAVQ